MPYLSRGVDEAERRTSAELPEPGGDGFASLLVVDGGVEGTRGRVGVDSALIVTGTKTPISRGAAAREVNLRPRTYELNWQMTSWQRTSSSKEVSVKPAKGRQVPELLIVEVPSA